MIPDWDVEDLLVKRFGPRGHPVRRYWRMMYWMPKFNNLSPWPIPKPAPNDAYELALLAIKRICSVDVESDVKVYKTKDLEENIEDTWIVSGQSTDQKKLIANHPDNVPIYIEGGFRIWLRKQSIIYFILRTEPPPMLTNEIIEDEDGKNFFFKNVFSKFKFIIHFCYLQMLVISMYHFSKNLIQRNPTKYLKKKLFTNKKMVQY